MFRKFKLDPSPIQPEAWRNGKNAKSVSVQTHAVIARPEHKPDAELLDYSLTFCRSRTGTPLPSQLRITN